MENKIPTTEELNKLYKDYYILLDSSLLGKRLDIVRCVSTRSGYSTIIKTDGRQHSFAAGMEYGIKEKWFIPFSHIEFAKLHCEAQLEAILENAKVEDAGSPDLDGNWHPWCLVDKDSIRNAYNLKENIK